jgi:hypothetical protein
MRKRYRVLILATLVAALVVPLGFALSLESPMPHQTSVGLMASAPNFQISDSVGLFLVGTMLVGLAAVVRKRV